MQRKKAGALKKPGVDGAVSRRMAATRSNNRLELELRSQLHREGLRFRVHRRLLPDQRRSVDVVFVAAKVACFIDGCFWHGCPLHGTWPKTNAAFWKQKILANRERDRDTDRQLRALGWHVVRVWEHDRQAAKRIAAVVRRRLAERRQSFLRSRSP